MENFAVRFADLLEDVATRVRSMTVDRLSKLITMVAIGIGAALLASAAGVFLLIGLFRLVAIPIGTTAAYAVFGGLFVGAGALVWRMRTTTTGDANG